MRAQSFQSCPTLATLWTVARQAPLSKGFSRQEYWSGLPHPPPGDLPDPGTEPASLVSPVLAGRFLTTSVTWKAQSRFQVGPVKSNWTVVPLCSTRIHSKTPQWMPETGDSAEPSTYMFCPIHTYL